MVLPVLILASATPLFASATQSQRAEEPLTVSLITCWPGDEVYELCGHEAVRVRGEGIDSVWNYGTFDFTAPNFIYRFVKGETDYMLSSYPFAYFLPEYENDRRRVVEQDLNLTPAEARRLLGMLREEALPQNRVYRYNYVKDNCATRIVERIDQAVGSRVAYTDSLRYGSFRDEMRAFHKNYPWYQFGIDLALGSGIDRPTSGRQEMFVPVDMMQRVASAHLADGRPLVKDTRVLVEGSPDATLGPTPWWKTPLFWSCAVFTAVLTVCLSDIRRRKLSRWLWTAYFLPVGIAGCVVAFLVFVSEHEATSPNALLVWLNPLQLATAACVWWRKARKAEIVMNYYNIAAVGVLILVWPLQPQSANPAFFPLMACACLLGATYAIIAHKSSYFKQKEYSRGASVGPKGRRRPQALNNRKR